MPINTKEEMLQVEEEKKSALIFRKRRHEDWNTNYILYRDKVITNRLTQRQTANIPLMKYGLQTIMKDIDEPPLIYFESKDGDAQAEIYYNEYWNDIAIKNKLVIRDRIDKKQAILYGRSFKKLNVVDGAFKFEIIDPQDMLVERHIDPADLDSARVIIQTGIWRTLSDILENDDYDEVGKLELQDHFDKDSNSQESASNFEQFTDKVRRMADMGLIDAYSPFVGETYIELNEVYRKEYDATLDETIIMMFVVASTESGLIQLSKKPLHEVIGATTDNYWYSHFPYSSWATDPERTDFWSDSPADVLRQPNLILNSWISQLVENRTLRNFNMHYYDSSDPQFVPQTYSPIAWGWYPVDGNPNDKIKDVVVGDLSDSLAEMQFVIGIAEKAVATSGSQTGQIEQRQVTLGEVQIAVQNAQDRNKSMSAYYQESWEDFGLKYSKMLDAVKGKLDSVDVFKKDKSGEKLIKKTIKPKMWDSKSGYRIEVKMKSDQVNQDASMLERLNAVKGAMPNNMPLQDIYKKHLLDFAGLTSEEMKQVMDFEKTAPQTPSMPMLGQGQANPQVVSNPIMPSVATPPTVGVK